MPINCVLLSCSLYKPSELQTTIDRRTNQQVGTKRHKVQKAKGSSKGRPVACIDPHALRVDHGIFQSDNGVALSQVLLANLSAGTGGVSGVVLTSTALALPYLRAGKVLSTGALGFFLVDGTDPPSTELEVIACRVPLVCAANSEPLLVDGFLVQFGMVPVRRKPASAECSVQTVPTCVVKAMVYRDLTTEPWHDVTAHPMKHIFAKIPPLQVCDDVECPGCEAWHRPEQSPLDAPVVEVWGKQWMKLHFASCPPTEAEVFSVHLRIPDNLQHVVQEFSGFAGVGGVDAPCHNGSVGNPVPDHA